MSPRPSLDRVLVDATRLDLEPPEGASWTCVRLPGLGAPWPARADVLQAHPEAWSDAGLVLVLADDVEIAPAAITELFRLMRAHSLRLAQPSLAWRSHFVESVTLHNPSFAWRHASRVDAAALAFDVPMLRGFLALAPATRGAATLGWIAAAAQLDPAHGAAVVDAVQAVRHAPPGPDEQPAPEDPLPTEAGLSWGGLGARGQRVDLFDDTREQFLGLLSAGYACAVQEPQAIGDVFLQHFLRSLEPPPVSLVAPDEPALQPPAPVAWKRLRRAPIVP